MADDWPSEDVVLLLAVRSSGRAGSLRRVILELDALSHGIPPEEALVASMQRLIAAGLLELDGERLRLTQRGRDLVRSTSKLYPRDHVEALHRALAAVPVPGADTANVLPVGAYAQAVSDYRKL